MGQVSSVENQFNKKIVLTGMLCCCQAPKFAVSGTCGAATSGILPCSICCENSSRISCNEKRRSEEHTSELQSLMRISYAVFCLKKTRKQKQEQNSEAHNKFYHHNNT